jgi:tripartite-type tricarboxylate transporter receptor subunit TctC
MVLSACRMYAWPEASWSATGEMIWGHTMDRRALLKSITAAGALATAGGLASLHAAVSSTAAQPYPSQTIRIVLGGAAGTAPDIVSRIVANQLSESEGWRIVVENKTGATVTLAAPDVLRQAADGHSILAIALASTIGAALLPKAGLRLDVDFVPVIKLTTSHHVLVVNPALPVRSMAELVALLKLHPDEYPFSSGGLPT